MIRLPILLLLSSLALAAELGRWDFAAGPGPWHASGQAAGTALAGIVEVRDGVLEVRDDRADANPYASVEVAGVDPGRLHIARLRLRLAAGGAVGVQLGLAALDGEGRFLAWSAVRTLAASGDWRDFSILAPALPPTARRLALAVHPTRDQALPATGAVQVASAMLEEIEPADLRSVAELVDGFTGLDLAPVANRALRDEVADDGQGGWTDQGDNDLRAFVPGWRLAGGVPFAVANPGLNQGRAALILHRGKAPAFAEEAEVAVDRCAERVYLLHAAAWSGPDELVGRLEFRYADGGVEGVGIINGRQVADWWGSEARLAAALPVARPPPLRSPVTLYAVPVANPHPQRRIRALGFRSPDPPAKCYWMVLAATLGHGQDPLVPTMWVDGRPVAVGEERIALGLIDPDALVVPELPARAEPGETIALSIDLARVLRPTSRAAGIAVHRILGYGTERYSMPFHRDPPHAWNVPPVLEQRIRDLRLPMTRFYGVGAEPIPVEAAIDRIAEYTARMGIPQEWTVLELEEQGASVALPPERWAAAARHVVAKGYGFRRWELGNEVYASIWKDGRHGRAFPTSADYIAHARAVAAAIRAVQPAALIGVSYLGGHLAWGERVLKELAGSYDFVVGHWYQFNNSETDIAATVIDENRAVLERVRRTSALIAAYNPGRAVTQLDTEWGMHARPSPERCATMPPNEVAMLYRRNGNLVGAMARAVRMIHYLREGVVEGACGWGMFGLGRYPAFTTVPVEDESRDRTTVMYWLYHQLNRHLGGQVLDSEGTVPFRTATRLIAGREGVRLPLTPVLATAEADGSCAYLVVANGSWDRAFPARFTFRGLVPGQAVGTFLSQDDPDGPALLDRPEEVLHDLPVVVTGDVVTFTLPPHAIVFVRVPAAR